MSSRLPEDILLPVVPGAADRRPNRSRLVAFVPITVAIIGVAAILVGQVSVQEVADSEAPGGVDPVITGSVQTHPTPPSDNGSEPR